MKRATSSAQRRGSTIWSFGRDGILVLAGVVVVLAGGTIAAGAAPTSTSPKAFTASLAPAAVTAGTTATLELTLTNASSTQAVGSANVTVPSGFTVADSSLALSTPAGKPWRAPELALLDGSSTILLRAGSSKSALAPEQSLVLRFSAAVSCAAPRPATWTTHVKQSNDFLGTGNDVPGASPSVNIAGGGAASFAFDPISTQEVGTPFMVRVTAFDACGDRADYDETVSLTGLASGVGATPSPATMTFSDGLATAAVTAVKSQADARLTVDGRPTGATSDPFDVVDRLCRAGDPVGVCESSDESGSTTVRTPLPTGDATMTLTFDAFTTKLSCSGADLAGRGSLATIDPLGYPDEPIPLTLRWSKAAAPATGVANFVLCMSKTGETYMAAPACTKAGRLPPGAGFCELKRSRNGVGELVIEILIHPTDPVVGLT